MPIDEKTAYKREAKIACFDDLRSDESYFNAYLSSVGITTKVSVKKSFRGKIVALGGGNAYNFTAAQLKALFKDNFVVVDGGAARILIDRGHGCLIGATGYRTYISERDVHSYEEVKDDVVIDGKKGYRTTAFGKAGDYVKIDYVDESGAQSFVYDYLGNKLGVGDMDGGRYFVIPYVINNLYLEQYNELRTTLLKAFLRKSDARLVLTNHAGVYAYLYERRSDKILIVVNSTEEDFATTELELRNIDVTKISAINRKSGKKRRVDFERVGDKYIVKTKNEHLTTQTFVLA